MARVLRPGGRLVALTAYGRPLVESTRRAIHLARRESYPVQVLGQRAAVYILERV
jgi:hypothetical protein